MPRLIDADALEKEYRRQFDAVYRNVRDAVIPQDYYIERQAAYNKEIVRRDMEAFCEFLQSRPAVDAEPVRHGRWEQYPGPGSIRCTYCKLEFDEQKMPSARDYCPNCGAKQDLED